jgi:hypothetical protein
MRRGTGKQEQIVLSWIDDGDHARVASSQGGCDDHGCLGATFEVVGRGEGEG